MSLQKIITTGSLGLLLLGCEAGFSSKEPIENPIVVCNPAEGFVAPSYKFDRNDEDFLVMLGTNGIGFKFRDIYTGEIIKLYDNGSIKYKCEEISEQD